MAFKSGRQTNSKILAAIFFSSRSQRYRFFISPSALREIFRTEIAYLKVSKTWNGSRPDIILGRGEKKKRKRKGKKKEVKLLKKSS